VERENPILGSQTFIERVRQPAATLAREHPRYQRQALQTDPDRVISIILQEYHMKRDDIFRGVRGQENEARKVAMYLVKRCCDRTLPEIAGYFGIASYATVSWNCRTIGLQIAQNQ